MRRLGLMVLTVLTIAVLEGGQLKTGFAQAQASVASGRSVGENGQAASVTAPADMAEFEALVDGKVVVFTYADSDYVPSVQFLPPGRFVWTDQNNSWPGNFSYVNTGPDTGTITLTFDPNNDPDEYEHVFEVTFTSGTMGTHASTYTERGIEPVVASGHFKIEAGPPLREMVFDNPDPGKPNYVMAGRNASLQYWKTPDGAVSQALYRSADETVSVRTFYDEATGLPRKISDELSGNWLLIQENGADSVDLWFYDRNGTYQHGFAVFEDAGQYYLGEIAGLPIHGGKEITGDLVPTTASWAGSFTLEVDTGDLKTRQPVAADVAELMDDLAPDDTLLSGLSAGGTILSGLVDDSSGDAVAPADMAAFDALVGGRAVVFTYADSDYVPSVEFLSAGRFVWTDQNDSWPGNFSYVNTGPDTGTITLTYDPNNDPDEYEHVFEVTFTSGTMGAFGSTYTERGKEPAVTSGHFKIADRVATAGAAAFVTSLFVPDVAAGNRYKCTRLRNATSRDVCRLATDFLAHEVERGPTGLIRDMVDWVRDNPVHLGDRIDRGKETLENVAGELLPGDAIQDRQDTEPLALEIPPAIGSRVSGKASGPDGTVAQVEGDITWDGDFAVTGDDNKDLSIVIKGTVGDDDTADSGALTPTLRTGASSLRAAMGNVVVAADTTGDSAAFEWGSDSGSVRSVRSAAVLHGDAPVVVRKILVVRGPSDGSSVTLDLSEYFSDPNGDPMRFTAAASIDLLDVRVSGSMLSIRQTIPDINVITRIRVTATDPGGLTAEMSFAIRISAPKATTSWSWITARSQSWVWNAYPGWEIRGNSNVNRIFDCHELVILDPDAYQREWLRQRPLDASDLGRPSHVMPNLDHFRTRWHREHRDILIGVPEDPYLYDALPRPGQRPDGIPAEGLKCSDSFVTYGGCRRTSDWGTLTSFFGCNPTAGKFCQDAQSWLKGVCRVEDPNFNRRPGVWVTERLLPRQASIITRIKGWIIEYYDVPVRPGKQPRKEGPPRA